MYLPVHWADIGTDCHYARRHPPGCLRRPDCHVDASEIEAIRAVLQAGVPYRASTVFQTGDPVRILDARSPGSKGPYARSESRRKLLVSIGLLQRSVLVDIDPLRLAHILRHPVKVAHA